jgi:hypothetical protein
MIADSNNHDLLDLSSPRAWAEAWHLWTVIVPRRSITGRLVSGKVWRRYSAGAIGFIRSSFLTAPLSRALRTEAHLPNTGGAGMTHFAFASLRRALIFPKY